MDDVVSIVLAFGAIAVVVLVATVGIWWVLKAIGRITGVDERVDRAFDTEGRLDTADYLKSREQHPRGGAS